jgi:alkanesulfonate monooxygenase SsuD/methylene tetrahydromethanopterin reductase-like flavin-dependent oxidoreductase (luciferase family)
MKDLTEPGLIGLAVNPAAARSEQALALAQLADTHHADLISVNDEPWVPEHVEAFTLLTTLAARTDYVAVLSNVVSLPMRPLVLLAKITASLDALTGGRVVLGLGAGDRLDDIAAAGGARRTVGESVAALAEAIPVLRRLWTPDTPTAHDGRFYQLGEIAFGPVPKRQVPIWTGAFGPRMLALTGRLADGWLPSNYFLDLADVPGMQQRIDAAATEAGRDPSGIRRVFNVMGAITDAGPTENGRSLIGPPSLWVDALNDYHQRLGFDAFVFWPTARDRMTQAHRFLEEVRPALPPEFQPS